MILFALVPLLLAVWIALALGVGADGWRWSGLSGLQGILAVALATRGVGAGRGRDAGGRRHTAATDDRKPDGRAGGHGHQLWRRDGRDRSALTFPAHTRLAQIAAAGIGAFIVLALVLLFSRRSEFSPERACCWPASP